MAARTSLPGNALLARLPASQLSFFGRLESVALAPEQLLESPGDEIPFVYFIDSGLVSVTGRFAADKQIEIGLVGFEGMTGTAVLLGVGRSANETVAQTATTARRIKSVDLIKALDETQSLRELFLKYTHVFMMHCSHAAVANAKGTTDERLARWLLSAQDRTLRNELRVTHELLSNVLSVRRASVTLALHKLENIGLLKSSRRLIEITNRAGLRKLAEPFYGIAEAEYESLIGPLPKWDGKPIGLAFKPLS